MNNDNFKNLINRLISAYGAMGKENPNEKVLSFGKYTRDEVIWVTFFILRTELDDFSGLTFEEFIGLPSDSIIDALERILREDLGSSLPQNLEELVELMEENPPGEPSTKSVVSSLDPQSPEARLARMINSLRVEEAVEKVVTNADEPQLVLPKYTKEIKKVLATEGTKQEFREKLSQKIGREDVTDSYLAYLDQVPPEERIPAIDAKQISRLDDGGFLGLPQVLAIPYVFVEAARQNLVNEVRTGSKEIEEKLVSELRASGMTEEGIKEFVSSYKKRVANLNAAQLEYFSAPAIPSGSANVLAIAKEQIILNEVLPIVRGPISSKVGGHEISLPPRYSFILPLAARIGGKETAKENPAQAVANDLFLVRGVKSNDKNFDLIAKRLNLSSDEINLIKSHLNTLERAFPGYKPTVNELSAIITAQIGSVENRGGEQNVYERYVQALPPVRGIGGLGLRLGQQFFGKAADRYLDGAIRRGLISNAKDIGEAVVDKLAGAIIKKATQGLIKIAAQAIGVTSGILTGGLSIALAWAIGKAQIGIRKNSGKVLAALGALGGLLLGGPIGAFFGGALGAAAAGMDWKKIVKWLAVAAALLLTAIISTVAIPLVIVFIVVPLFFVFTIFIINSGAYLVPPGASVGGELGGLTGSSGFISTASSPYIDVIKTATPGGPFQNSDSSLKEITYKITVRAKKGTLTNLKFQNVCQVITKSNPYGRATCTASLPPEDQIPQSISPIKAWEFSYSMDLSSFSDAYVIDTFTVTADTADKKGETAAGSASVKIGTPPESCPSGWPIDGPITITQGPQGSYSHQGYEAVDLKANLGTPVRATHSGVVIAQIWNVSYGHHVRINSTCGGKQFQSVYAHLDHILVTSGQTVTAGQIIGTVNSTGKSDANHLHYEFRPILSGSNDGPVKISDEPLLMRDYSPYGH